MTDIQAPKRSIANRWRMRFGDPVVKLLAPMRRSTSTGVLHTIRKDGSPRSTALVVWRRGDERFVIALYGITYWARDLRTGRPAELELAGTRAPMTAMELAGDEGFAFWRWFTEANASSAKRYTKASAHPGDGELRQLVETFPAFRIS